MEGDSFHSWCLLSSFSQALDRAERTLCELPGCYSGLGCAGLGTFGATWCSVSAFLLSYPQDLSTSTLMTLEKKVSGLGNKPSMVAKICKPSTQKASSYEFEASLGYSVSAKQKKMEKIRRN